MPVISAIVAAPVIIAESGWLLIELDINQ